MLLSVLVAVPLRCTGEDLLGVRDALPLVETFSRETLGTTGSITAICEGEGGKVYAGSDKLYVFDGAVWSHVELQNTPILRSLAVGSQKIWVGGAREAGYFEKDHDGAYRYTSLTGQLSTELEGTVWYTLIVSNQVVFITERKVISWPMTGGEPRVWELPNDRRLAAQQLPSGDVLIGQSLAQGNKLWLLKQNGLEPVTDVPPPLSKKLFDFVSEENGHWKFNAGYDIFDYDLAARSIRPVYLDDGVIRRAIITRGVSVNGYIYLGTVNSGLLIVTPKGELVQPAGKDIGIADRSPTVVPSALGGVWVGHDRGLSYVYPVDRCRILFPSASVRALAANVQQVVGLTNHDLWQLTAQGVRQFPFTGLALGLSGESVYVTNIGSVLTKAPQDEEFRKLFSPPSRAGGLYRLLIGRKDPNLLYVVSAINVTEYNQSTGTVQTLDLPDTPTNIVECADGSLLVGTMTGGVRVIDPTLQRTTVKLPTRELTSVALHNGEPLMLVRKRGLVESNGRVVKGTGDLIDISSSGSNDGPTWIVGTTGDVPRIGVVEQGASGLAWRRKNIPGLGSLRGTTAIARADRRLYVALESGVVDVDIESLTDVDVSVPQIEELKIRNIKSHAVRSAAFNDDPNRKLELSTEEREIAISLRRRFWPKLEQPMFQSRLLPIEDDWTSHPYGELITRKNLLAGNYTLQIRAVHLGETGPATEYRFIRLPPWYASQAGVTVMALGVVILFLGAVKFRTRQIEQKNRELEDKIRERTQELARANSAKSEFLAAMSHEIRNPMNGVIGIVKMLQESNLGVREKYLLSTLNRCAEQLRTTVDDVLDFSKIEAGEVTLQTDTFDLVETIRSTIAAVDITGQKAELSSWAGSRPMVTGDQGKLAQILTNYLSNALKYGVPPHATVDVFVLDEGDKRCRVTIAVKNTGPDIPPAEIERLFERFQRGEFAKVRRIGGNGLGLSICKRYAEVMGGSVGVNSSGGVTVFQVTLPFDKAEAPQPLAHQNTPKMLNARALAIEDEDYNRLVLGNVLQKLGYKVDWAADGKSALALAEQNGYDLILTDWMLPDIDGGTLSQKILEKCEEPKPPIFAVTAYSTKEKQDECLAAGMAGFIAKPVTIEKLKAALKDWAANRVTRPVFEDEETATNVSLEQLSRLGVIETIVPEFTRRLEQDWSAIEQLLKTDTIQAANAAHKLVSATLLVSAQYVSDQLRILEDQLRKNAPADEIAKLRDICAEEIAKVSQSLRAAARRQRRLAETESAAKAN